MSHFPKATSLLRTVVAALLVAATMTVATTSPARVARADSGEAAYGTPTQALESAISLGDSHTCVIINGNVVCYGANSNGQLGNGTTETSRTPVYVRDSATNTGARLSGVISVAAAAEHTCALISNGKVKCWGYGYRTGTGKFGEGVLYPAFVKSSFTEGDANISSGPDLTGAIAITSATYGGCALLNDGKVKCWGGGAGHDGEGVDYVLACTTPLTTGNCSTTGSNQPLTNVKSITQAGQTTCGILSDDSLVCWGQDQGKLANPDNVATDTQLPKPAGSSTIGARAFGTTQGAICGLYQNGAANLATSGGKIRCWGSNGSGQLGRGFTDSNLYKAAADVVGMTNAIAISGHGSSFCALLITSEVKCWGSNPSDQFATGFGVDVNVPTSMRDGANPITGVSAVTLGQSHICLIMAADGSVRCLGSNTSGQLGDGTIVTKGVPTSVLRGEVEVVGGGATMKGAGADIAPPALLVQEVNAAGSKVILTYDESLATTGLPPTSLLTVKVGGVPKTVTSVTANGSTLELNLAERITPSSVVLVSYRDPSVADDIEVVQDASFNDAASFTDVSVTNRSVTEGVAPTVQSAAVGSAGTGLTLTFSEALGTTTAAAGAFAVTVGGVSRTVTGTAVSGSTVVLTLSPAVLAGSVVTVAYTAPTVDLGTTNNAVQDSAGNDAAGFSSSAVNVVNNSTFDNVAPTFLSAAVSGDKTKVVLTYNETLGAVTAATGAFAVTVATVSRGVTGVAVVGATIELTLASAVSPGQAVTIGYTAPSVSSLTSNFAVQDVSGNDAVTLSTTSVTNIEDTTAPTLVSGAVNAAGTKLILTYNEALSATTAAAETFAVTVDGALRGVSSVAVSASTVELTLASIAGAGFAVTVAYTAPAVNAASSNAAIQDTAGNDAVSFASNLISVTNSSNIDLVVPTFTSGAVNSIGSLVLTYSETLGTNGPASSTVTVQINGVTVTVSSVTILNATVVVVTSPVIGVGDTVTFSYVKPTAGNDAFAIQDAAGNDVASSSSAYSVPSGSNNSVVDTAKPTLTSGAVTTDGKLVLTYNETLGTPGPLASQVTVTVNGETVVVTGVVVSGSTVVITTNPPIETGDVVTYSYTDPTAGNDAAAIQDAAGNDVATSGTAYSVPSGNNASTIDTRQPAFVGGAVSGGGTLVLTYSEPLDGDGPSTSSIVVTINGVEVTVTDVAVIGSTIVVTTSPLIGPDDVVTYKYVDPSAGNDSEAIQDSAGNDIATSNTPYALPANGNGSTVDKVKPAAPTDVSINTGGDKITMVFPEDMSGTKPAGSDFTVTVDGVVYTVTGVEINGKDVVLIVSPSIKTGQTVTIGYKDPSAGNDGNALQDAAGNDVSSFSGTKVNNKSVQPSAVNQVDSILDSTLPLDRASVDAVKVVDGDAASASTSMSETMTVSGKSGTAKFSDGSSFAVSKNGNLIPKLFTAYIGTVTGSVKVTYKVGKKTTSVTCSYGKYGSTKPKKVTKSQNGWYPKAFISPKKSCKMPAAAIKALNTQMVTIAANLKFVRLWPTTGKPKNPESGAAVRPVKRSYSVKIGTEPK